MENLRSVAAIYLTLLSFTSYVIIYTYPAGDYSIGPFYILTFGIPVTLIHIILTILYYTKKKSNSIIWISGVLSLFSIAILGYFLYSH